MIWFQLELSSLRQATNVMLVATNFMLVPIGVRFFPTSLLLCVGRGVFHRAQQLTELSSSQSSAAHELSSVARSSAELRGAQLAPKAGNRQKERRPGLIKDQNGPRVAGHIVVP